MADYSLSERAATDMEAIFRYSVENWGERRAERYIASLYAMFATLAVSPHPGRKRTHRAHPFLMAPAERHFIIYEIVAKTVVILTIQHQRRDIETLIKAMRPELLKAIAAIQSL